jgi:hypothetical protein
MTSPAVNLPSDNQAFEYLVSPSKEGQEGLFPMREISVVAGAGGSGKTTWLLQFLQTWEKHEQFFGRETNPVPYLIVMRDRSKGGFRRTCRRMHINYHDVPVYRATLAEEKLHADELLEDLHRRPEYSNVRLFVFEGLDMWIPNGNINSFNDVSYMLGSLKSKLEDLDAVLIGTVGQPKMKAHDKYALTRDCLIGTSVWSRKVETIVYVEEEDPKMLNGPRVLTILPRNGMNERTRLAFKDGRLVEIAPITKIPTAQVSEPKLFGVLRKMPMGAPVKWSIDMGIAESTFYRDIKQAEKIGLVFTHEGIRRRGSDTSELQ